MRYLGGKSRTAREIAYHINSRRRPNQTYWEPFCGACWITERVLGDNRYASDANPYLIAMWQAVQNGWVPPESVSEAEYASAKRGEYEPHLEAFICFGCSFGGKWGAGYARGDGRNWAAEASQSIMKKASRLTNVNFYVADFLTIEPLASNCLIYCDPPYANTSGYDAVDAFNSELFWDRVRYLANQGHTLMVSEYNAPSDFTPIWVKRTKTDMNTLNGKDSRIEKLFMLGDNALLQPELF